MATNYGKERTTRPLNQVDWGAIGRQTSDELRAQEARREEIRTRLEQESRDLANTIADSPQGQNRTLNSVVQELSSSAADMRLMQENLFKSGQLDHRDYLTQRQSLRDGIQGTYELVNGYNEKYEENMQMVMDGEASALMQYNLERIEGFSDFSKTQFYVDPNSGNVMVGNTIVEDGVRKLDNTTLTNVNAAFNRLNMRQNKVDVEGQLETGAKALANKFMQSGTVSDVRGMPEYESAKQTFIDSVMNNEVTTGNILLDYVSINPETGKAYSFTSDPAEAESDPNKILVQEQTDGTLIPQLSEQDEKNVRQALNDRFESMVNREMRYVAPQRPYGGYNSSRSGAGSQRQADEVANVLGKVFTASDQNEVDEALNYLVGRDPSISNLQRTENELIITKVDSNGSRVTRRIPIGTDMGSFIRAAAPELVEDENVIGMLSRAGYQQDAVAGTTTTSSGRYPEFADAFANAAPDGASFSDYSSDETVSAMSTLFRTVDPSAVVSEDSNWVGGNSVLSITMGPQKFSISEPSGIDDTMFLEGVSSVLYKNRANGSRMTYDEIVDEISRVTGASASKIRDNVKMEGGPSSGSSSISASSSGGSSR